MKEHIKIEQNALKVSMLGAFLLAVWGIFMGGLSSSWAVMFDGVFNLISAVMTLFSLMITRMISDNRATRDFPLGYYAFESLFVLVKGFSILVMIVIAVWSNIQVLLAGGRELKPELMAVYVAVASSNCLILFLIVRRGGKKTHSDILYAESQAWLINTLVSGSIGVALAAAFWIQGTEYGWINRYLDQVLVILFSIIIKDPLLLVKNGLGELLLAAPQKDYAQSLKQKILPFQKQLGARAILFEVIKTGRRLWVTIRIDPVQDSVNMDEFMELVKQMRSMTKEVYANTQTVVILERL